MNAITRTLQGVAVLCVLLLAATPAAPQVNPGSRGKAPASPPEVRRGLPSPPAEGPGERDQRAEQVLLSAVKAHGGTDAIAGRQTVYLKSRIRNFEFPDTELGTITVWFKRPSKIRQEVAYPQMKEIRVFDGERAWLDDGTGPRLLGPLMALMMQRGILEIDSPLLYLQGSLRYLSVAKDPKGRVTQKLSWRHQGYARDLMIDASTNRVLTIGEFDTPAGAISRMKIFDDFRPVQGMVLPFHQETFRNDQKYSEVDLVEARFNIPVDDSLFEYPGPEPAEEGTAPPASRSKAPAPSPAP